MSKIKFVFIGSLAAAALAAAPPASAQMRNGTLTCNLSGGLGIGIGSSRDANCLYTPARGRPQAYGGTVNNIGLDVGASASGQVSFAVVGDGPIAGTYSGPGLGLALGGGSLGGTALTNGGVMLQPLTGSLRSGIGISAGIGSINLQAIPTVYQSGRRQAVPRG